MAGSRYLLKDKRIDVSDPRQSSNIRIVYLVNDYAGIGHNYVGHNYTALSVLCTRVSMEHEHL